MTLPHRGSLAAMMTLERRPFLAVVAMLALVTAIVFDLVACGGSSDTTGESGPPTEVRVPAPARYAAGQEVIAHRAKPLVLLPAGASVTDSR
jgi:hypothetical protein